MKRGGSVCPQTAVTVVACGGEATTQQRSNAVLRAPPTLVRPWGGSGGRQRRAAAEGGSGGRQRRAAMEAGSPAEIEEAEQRVLPPAKAMPLLLEELEDKLCTCEMRERATVRAHLRALGSARRANSSRAALRPVAREPEVCSWRPQGSMGGGHRVWSAGRRGERGGGKSGGEGRGAGDEGEGQWR